MTGPDLQLTHLRALEAIGRHGTFSRAARELRLTQPAVSMQIRLLERQVGVPLLERVGKRTLPTAAGAVMLEHAARAFRELRAGLDRVQELRGVVAGQVRLGTSAAISVYLLPRALRTFRARYPAIELVVMTGLASDIARLVVANELDLGLVTLPLRERALAITPFYRDELVAIAARDRAWPRRSAVTAAELAREPMILFDHGSTVRRVIDQWFHRAGVAPRAAMELGNTEAIKKLVEARLGLSVTSEFSVKADVAAGLLGVRRLHPPLFRQIGLVRRRDKALTAPVHAFVAALDQLGRALSGRQRSPRA